MAADDKAEPADGDDDGSLAYFGAIPWCAALLAAPGMTVVLPNSRRALPSTEHSLFGETLRTERAVAAFVLFYEAPPPPSSASASSSSSSSSPSSGESEEPSLLREVQALVALGPGVNGHPEVCHGGVVAAVLDEVMGMLIPLNLVRGGLRPRRARYSTAYLHTAFAAPVRTPAVVRVAARLARRHGRKLFVDAEMRDAAGAVLARADALFVAWRERL